MDERRYIGLDALRGFMMLLGIVLHAAMLYLASPPPAMPVPTDRNHSVMFDVLFDFIHSFRMPTFFLVAGFFAAMMVQRRGLLETWRNRARRILLPWLASLVLILPVTVWFTINFWLAARYGTHQFIPDLASLLALGAEMKQKIGPRAEQPMMAHLWFLYYLCMFYLLIPLCRWALCKSLSQQARIRQMAASPFAALILALWTALTLWPFQGGQMHEGFIYFIPHPPSLLYYGSFFVLGYAIHTYREFLPSTMRYLPWAWASTAVLFPLALLASAADIGAQGGSARLHGAAVLLNAGCTWALIYAFMGTALRFFDRASPWIDYMAQSAYWVYLVHLPLVMLAGWILIAYDLSAFWKFFLVCGFTGALALTSFHYAVQGSWISTFLYGRRLQLDWPWRRR
jgi:glucans biosynthesis protein C